MIYYGGNIQLPKSNTKKFIPVVRQLLMMGHCGGRRGIVSSVRL